MMISELLRRELGLAQRHAPQTTANSLSLPLPRPPVALSLQTLTVWVDVVCRRYGDSCVCHEMTRLGLPDPVL